MQRGNETAEARPHRHSLLSPAKDHEDEDNTRTSGEDAGRDWSGTPATGCYLLGRHAGTSACRRRH
jgi:hypothetical protein